MSLDNYNWSEQYSHRRADFEINGYKGFVILPDGKKSSPIPWVWYAPTFIGAHPNQSNGWISRKVLAEGIAIAGIEVGESSGNLEGRAAFTRFHEFVTGHFNLAPNVCLWAQSRGGLMLYNWAAEHPELVQCIGGTYTVCDLRSFPGLNVAAPAYGMTESELEAHLSEHNPIDRLAPIAAHEIPILHIHGDEDGLVPLEANSLELINRYKALGGPAELLVIQGKGHAEIPEFFERQEMVDFFINYAKG